MFDNKVYFFSNHLINAEIEHKVVEPLTVLDPNISVEEAYQVQLVTIQRKLEDGQRIVGKKIGLTSLAMQQLLGVDQPDYGHLLDSMVVENEGVIKFERVLQPKVEAEIAFVLKHDLIGPGVSSFDVLQATEHVLAAIEIVDSRIKDWKVMLQDTIADNASSGLFVLGNKPIAASDIDLAKVKMDLYKNGDFVNSGVGADVLGNPANCVAWLANKLSEFGIALKAGEVILSGAFSAAVDAAPGDHFVARFTDLGEVSVSFSV
ncbi:2-keto-4-pentenoate hydratase [Parageobacillus thermoglucosidasius]|uniref:2-keto-4-pentenoate hydratase n=1 Tax=Parageobacillus thermoglucosidasius TaxID=1426 RepID=UPI000B5745BB|nr:fumarylacetoacetate hydrolase family protein [Parageobacillus thermoglucosidasius]OUM86335.1 MAG: 2-keto-4-pentenoate hydratase [Parageobacillus thermoglucosidasius]